MRSINRIIIHHSASPYACVSIIRDWHKARGFRDCGYSCCILNGTVHTGQYDPSLDGAIEIGRPWDQIGAHAKGHNADSLGVCLIGQGPDFSAAQYASLKKLLTMFKAMWPGLTIIGHRDVGQTQCPGFSVVDWCQQEGI